jgi:uncharacterized phage infection (PIP) family protein YhgE
MSKKGLKSGLIVVAIVALIGVFVFGTEAISYVRSSARSVQSAVKSSVPIEFELRRARDMLEDIIPEMHANIRRIAQEEVEVIALKGDIGASEENLNEEKERISKLRESLSLHHASYSFGDYKFTRNQVKEDLSHRFERFKEAEMVLSGKERLLMTREKSLQAAKQLLERTESQKQMLKDKIEGLASQYRLLKASATGSAIQIDNSKMAQTEKLINQIKKRLSVAERVLALESKFVQDIPVDTVNETDLLAQVDDYFAPVNDETAIITAVNE